MGLISPERISLDTYQEVSDVPIGSKAHAGDRHDRGIVRELTEAMGGSADVENLDAGGASFTVRLPR